MFGNNCRVSRKEDLVASQYILGFECYVSVDYVENTIDSLKINKILRFVTFFHCLFLPQLFSIVNVIMVLETKA